MNKPEILLLRLFIDYSVFQKFYRYLDVSSLPRELETVYRALEEFFKRYGRSCTLEELEALVEASVTFRSQSERETYAHIFAYASGADVAPDVLNDILKQIKLRRISSELGELGFGVADGRVSLHKLESKISELQESVAGEDQTAVEYVSDDLEEIYNQTVHKPGLRWRLDSLNKSLGSLRKGDFGFIFARPETGKTTFLTSEVTYMASQTSSPVLWFNNEEQGFKVMGRNYQAALGLDMPSLMGGNRHKLMEKFREVTKGNIRIIDNAAQYKYNIESIVRETNPSLIIFDQIDKIKGFDNDREDLRLGSIYIWARELAKMYAPVIGVCQADGSGEGQRYLTMSNVANAKTAKQAEADWILGIGMTHDEGYEYVRYLNISKNKLIGDEDSDPTMRHMKHEVLIEPSIARYKEIM